MALTLVAYGADRVWWVGIQGWGFRVCLIYGGVLVDYGEGGSPADSWDALDVQLNRRFEHRTSWSPGYEEQPAGMRFTRLRRGFMPYWVFGLLGAGLVVLARWAGRRFKASDCRVCGYDLTGNVSGKCPECGEPLN